MTTMTRRFPPVLLLLLLGLEALEAFVDVLPSRWRCAPPLVPPQQQQQQQSPGRRQEQHKGVSLRTHHRDKSEPPQSSISSLALLSSPSPRRDFLSHTTGGLLVAAATATQAQQSAFAADETTTTSTEQQQQQRVFQLPSGLKYVELVEGTGPAIDYGFLCTIAYQTFLKLPTADTPELVDQSGGYLVKHGNGRLIPGLDQGLHTMKVGGQRRLLIPPKLGYVDNGLGPVPSNPLNRQRLNRGLQNMIEQRGGTLIYQVTLLSAMPDEADQGYYQDEASEASMEQIEKIRQNLQSRK